MEIEGAVDEVDTDGSERFLLPDAFFVEHSDVDEDFGGIGTGLGLKTNAQPAIASLAASGDRICEGEKGDFSAAFVFEPLEEEIVFVIEHRAKGAAAGVAFGGALNGVADGHVIS